MDKFRSNTRHVPINMSPYVVVPALNYSSPQGQRQMQDGVVVFKCVLYCSIPSHSAKPPSGKP